MRFFYIGADNRAVGPVEGDALAVLRKQGLVRDDTRVAQEGDSTWRTFADFYRAAPAAPASDAPAAGPLPLSVQVFGIANIAFGVMGLLCIPVAAAGLILAAMGRGSSVPGGPWETGWLAFSMVLAVFLVLALLISGVGLCRGREWGRVLALTYAGVDIAQSIAAFGVNVKTSPFLWAHSKAPLHGLNFALLVVLLIIGLAYPVLLLVFLRRAAVREALQRRG